MVESGVIILHISSIYIIYDYRTIGLGIKDCYMSGGEAYPQKRFSRVVKLVTYIAFLLCGSVRLSIGDFLNP